MCKSLVVAILLAGVSVVVAPSVDPSASDGSQEASDQDLAIFFNFFYDALFSNEVGGHLACGSVELALENAIEKLPCCSYFRCHKILNNTQVCSKFPTGISSISIGSEG
mmetsp:Transcript_18124/g.25070  ORF Transcript_18124/g.25070 Transcript_18124/m.25070 type:complete len:109 (-) Transcript_18124:9-335(-)